jgi:hypothetical protein
LIAWCKFGPPDATARLMRAYRNVLSLGIGNDFAKDMAQK